MDIVAAPHMWEMPTAAEWQINFLMALVSVFIFDGIADRIPGVKGRNRLAQFLTLLSMASAMSVLFDVKLFASLPGLFEHISNELGSGFGISWNIIGIGLTAWGAMFFAKRYMGITTEEGDAERLLPDGLMFGVVIFIAASIFPFINEVLEFWRYSVISGLNIILIELTGLLDSVGFSVG